MAKPDRTAFARKHRAWLMPACAAVMVLGIVLGNIFAIFGGVFGMVWVARAAWKRE